MAIGNLSTSSLLKTAKSRREKQQAYRDSLVKFNFDSSSKTYDDYQEYERYLRSRLDETQDPSDALSIQRSIRTAQRTYTSHEIQRQTIKVLEGQGSLQGKYNAMVTLYDYSIANDDMDLAQSLRSQLDSLDIQLQNQRESAARAADKLAAQQVRTLKEYKDKLLYGENIGNGLLSLEELKQEYVATGLDMFEAAEGQSGGRGYWDYTTTIIEDIVNTYRDSAALISDPEQANKLLEEANDIVNGETTFDVAPGVPRLTYGEIVDARDAAAMGQNIFEPIQRGSKNEFKKTDVVDYVWGRDANGNVRIIELRDIARPENTTLDSKLDPTDEDEDAQTYRDTLLAAGYDIVEGGEDGRILVRQTANNNSQLPGIQRGQTFEVLLTGNGQLRFVTDASDPVGSRIFELNRESGDLREVSIEESAVQSVFSENKFLSPDPATSTDLVKQLTGQTPDIRNNLGDVNIDNLEVRDEFKGLAQPLSSEVLQGAEAIQQAQAAALEANRRSKFTSNRLGEQIQQAVQKNIQESVAKTSQVQRQDVRVQRTVGAGINQTQVPNAGLRVTSAQPQTRNLRVSNRRDTRQLSVQPLQRAQTDSTDINAPAIWTGTF